MRWQKFTSSIAYRMLVKVAKIVLAIVLSFTFTFSLWKIIICIHERYFDSVNAVDNWLDENGLSNYKQLYRDLGELTYFKSLLLHFCVVSLKQISIKFRCLVTPKAKNFFNPNSIIFVGWKGSKKVFIAYQIIIKKKLMG